MRGRIDFATHGCDGLGIAAVALEEFRVMIRGIAEEGEARASKAQQVARSVVAATEIIAAHRQSRLPGLHRAPAHEVRALADELFEA